MNLQALKIFCVGVFFDVNLAEVRVTDGDTVLVGIYVVNMLSIKSVLNDIILHINILFSNVVQMYTTDGFECFYHPISFVGITIAAKINKIDGVKAAN
jgi:hypothetical protein